MPPDQSRIMADALRAKGLPVAILTFAGEQHGFRKRDTIVSCLEAELDFYGAVFGFVPADRPTPPMITSDTRVRLCDMPTGPRSPPLRQGYGDPPDALAAKVAGDLHLETALAECRANAGSRILTRAVYRTCEQINSR